jgi:hypothetical protein
VQAQAKACGYPILFFEWNAISAHRLNLGRALFFREMIRKEKGKATKALFPFQTGTRLRGLLIQQNRGFPLMAALMLVLMVPVCMGMLMGMVDSLVLVLMPVVAVGTALVGMFVLMLVLVVAAHCCITSFVFFL